MVRSVSPEYMHLALLGVSKLMLSLWVNEMGLQRHITEIDKRINTIEVPSEIREPRGLSDLKHWKGKMILQCMGIKFTCIHVYMYSI